MSKPMNPKDRGRTARAWLFAIAAVLAPLVTLLSHVTK